MSSVGTNMPLSSGSGPGSSGNQMYGGSQDPSQMLNNPSLSTDVDTATTNPMMQKVFPGMNSAGTNLPSSSEADKNAEIEKKIKDEESRVVREEEHKEIMKKVDDDDDVDMNGKNLRS